MVYVLDLKASVNKFLRIDTLQITSLDPSAGKLETEKGIATTTP